MKQKQLIQLKHNTLKRLLEFKTTTPNETINKTGNIAHRTNQYYHWSTTFTIKPCILNNESGYIIGYLLQREIGIIKKSIWYNIKRGSINNLQDAEFLVFLDFIDGSEIYDVFWYCVFDTIVGSDVTADKADDIYTKLDELRYFISRVHVTSNNRRVVEQYNRIKLDTEHRIINALYYKDITDFAYKFSNDKLNRL